MATIYLFLFLFVLFAIHVSTRYSRKGRLLNKIPGPPGLPIIGNALSFFNADTAYLWNFIRQIMNEYYSIAKISILNYAAVLCRNPDDLEIFFTDRVNTSKGGIPYKYLEKWAHHGLITSSGEKWKNRRKILIPAFSPNVVKKYFEVVQEQGEMFIHELLSEGNETVHELLPLASKLTLRILLGSAMGLDLSSKLRGKLDKEIKDYQHAASDFLYVTLFRSCRPYISDWMLKFMDVGKKQEACLKILHDFGDKVIRERRKYKQNKYKSLTDFIDNIDDNGNDAHGPRKRLALLDLLLAAEDDGLIDDQGIKEEVNTFIAAGYDTISTALTFILMSLAENEEIQEKARAEAFNIMDKCQGSMTVNDLQNLHYIERCIKESLRIFPPVPLIFRTISKEMQLKNIQIPVGAQLGVPIYDVHNDGNHWPDPKKFDPDRFLPENSKNRHPYAYVPFSAGPRNCIGLKFAMMQLKAIVARILYYFVVKPVQSTRDLQFKLNVVLLPTVPVYAKFVKLKKC